MEQTKTDETTKRIAAPFTLAELELIDAWGFARRIRNRSDAVRELIKAGLRADKNEAP